MKRTTARVSVAAVVAALLAACSVKPLPVPHPEMWSPGYGATDFPGASRDAGADR